MSEAFERVPERALGIYAHPDDPDVSCGGTLASWAGWGCEVHVVICTDGGKGSADGSVPAEELARVRAGEAAAAASELGLAGQVLLGYPDGELSDGTELRSLLVAAVRRVRPEVVLCPDPTAVFFGQEYVNHRDHRITGWAALDAVAPAAALPHYFPDAGPPFQVPTVLLSGTLDPDTWVDVTGAVDAKGRAVGCHRSQFPDGAEWAADAVRSRAEDAGRRCGAPYAEEFRRLRLGG